MIRFKKAAPADVPTPPTDYVTLFVDATTGQPAAKGADGAVVSMKGADGADGADGTNGTNGADGVGVPADGTVGQVLTKTAEGVAWQDSTGGAPAGTWMSLLTPDGDLFFGDEPAVAQPLFLNVLLGVTEYYPYRDLLGKAVCGLRVQCTVDLQVQAVDEEAEINADGARLHIADTSIPIAPGHQVIEFELLNFNIGYDPAMTAVYLGGSFGDSSNVSFAWAKVAFSQLELCVVETGYSSTLTELTTPFMLPIALVGKSFGYGGLGFDPADNALLAAATTVDVIGYYDGDITVDAESPAAAIVSQLTYTAITPLPLTTGHVEPGTSAWWHDVTGDLPSGWFLAAVSIDEGDAVLARICNAGGY